MTRRKIKKSLLQVLADTIVPHYCCGCGSIGAVLCENCQYGIVDEVSAQCIICQLPSRLSAVCKHHRSKINNSFFLGIREDTLKSLVDDMKFFSHRAVTDVCAQMLHDILPASTLPLVFVPAPTSRRHVRMRGFAHSERIAQQLASLRSAEYAPLVRRLNSHVQYGASKDTRHKQAIGAYSVDAVLSANRIYVIVDDVYTTGATVEAIARELRRTGARHIWCAIVSRQILE